MNDGFVTRAIEDDRCLKAHRLLDRFETELDAFLTQMGRDMIEQSPDLFADDPNSNIKAKWDTSTVIANVRDNLKMARVDPDDQSTTMKLNISVRWVDPMDWGHDNVSGALCAVCYKINNGTEADYREVKEDTANAEWDLQFAADQYNNAPGIMYVPVESAGDLAAGRDTLQEHFAQFGDYWGSGPSAADDE